MPACRTNAMCKANRVGHSTGTGKPKAKCGSKRKALCKKKAPVRKTCRSKTAHMPVQAMQELAVYKCPFSVQTQQPRIPDGSRNHSLGASCRTHFGSLTGATGAGYIILFPGWNAHGACTNAAKAPTDALQAKCLSGGDTAATPFGALMEAYRGVSFGMKIRNVSSSMENGGTWQAIRVRPCAIATEGVVPATAVPGIATWANDPSFSSGRLRDIDKKDFILATENDEHLWLNKDDTNNFYDKSFDMTVVCVSKMEQASVDFFGNCEMTFTPNSVVNVFQLKTNQVLPGTLAEAQIEKRKKCSRAAS